MNMAEVNKLREKMMKFPEELERKPYMRLRKGGCHKWGGMRMWPKWKSLRVIWGEEGPRRAETWEESIEGVRKQLEESEGNGAAQGGPEPEVDTRRGDDQDYAGRDEDKEGCERCGGQEMDTAWQQVKWRPVVSYSNHYLKHLLGMAGRWATFVTIALGLGDYADDPREVTEDVHRYNEKSRCREDWVAQRQRENEERRRRIRRNKNEARRWPQLPLRRRLHMKIMDLKSFFIKVPRDQFVGKALPDIMVRLNDHFPGKSYF